MIAATFPDLGFLAVASVGILLGGVGGAICSIPSTYMGDASSAPPSG